jgi:hypothetical protein
LLADADVFLLSYDPKQATEWERGVIGYRRLRGTPVEEVAANQEAPRRAPLQRWRLGLIICSCIST